MPPRLLTACLAAALGVSALAAPAAGAATITPLGSTGADADRAELLLNGDRVVPVGAHQYAVLPYGAGLAAATIGLNLGGHAYEIPQAALPYLNHQLDPSLFDATLLPHNNRLRITISYPGATAPRLPGVRITSAAGGTASGYLTPASARVFGVALAALYNHDRANGTFGTDGMFTTVTAIRLAGTSPMPARSRPRFPMHTITLRGIDLNGRPDTGNTTFVFDTDNLNYFGDTTRLVGYFYHGITKYSLPTGHYVVIAQFYGARHGDVVDSLTVTRNATVTLDARTATSPVTFSTPKPAVYTASGVNFSVTDSIGRGFGHSSGFDDAGAPLYVSPMKQRSASGTLRVLVASVLASPAGTKSPYHYDLAFADPPNVIPRQQHYTATAANLATVRSRYYSDTRGTSQVLYMPAVGNSWFSTSYSFSAPSDETDYMSTGTPPVYWTTIYSGPSATAGQSNSSHAYLPGTQTTESWNAYPLHNPLDARYADGRDVFPTTLSATRTGNTMSFNITPFGDSVPAHYGTGFAVPSGHGMSGSYELDQNGKKIAAGNADQFVQGQFPPRISFTATAKVSPAPATFRLSLNADRSGVGDQLSTQTSTVWTWRSAHESGTVLPAGWVCPDNTRNCAAEPLMTLDYEVAGLGMDDVAPAGAQVVKVTVGHQQLAASAATTRVTASYSVDGGKSWQPASVKGSGTLWYAAYSAQAGSKVTLKVTADDSSGGAISETMLNAYATKTSAASAGYRSAGCATGKVGVHCFLLYSTQTARARGVAAGFPASAVSGPVGWGAKDLEKAYRLPVTHSGGTVAVVEALDTPQAGVLPQRLPQAVRAPALHHRQRLLPQGQRIRQGSTSAAKRDRDRLGRGGHARRRHGLSRLPEVPHPRC